jgi:plastocyanin
MKKIIMSLTAFSAVILLTGCGYQQAVRTNPASNQTQPANNQTASSSVLIKNFAFSPQTLTVKVGTTVTWTNEDSATHTIKSDTFNSGNIATGGKFEFKFDRIGTYDYSCSIHPSMTGKIIVE